MDIPGNLGASSVPPLPSRGCPISNKTNTISNTNINGAESKQMLMTAPRQQPLPALPASIQQGPTSAIGGGFPVANSIPSFSPSYTMNQHSYGGGFMPGRSSYYGATTANRYPYQGGSYGGYGSGYGAYNSSYGAYNNNSNYNTFITEINNLPAIQSLQSVVNTAGSVSVMLESCYNAVLASFQAMVGVADQFSKVKVYFTQMFGAIATFRLVKHLLKRLPLLNLNKNPLDPENIWDEGGLLGGQSVGESGKPKGSSYFNIPLLLYLGHLMAAPYIIWKLINHSQQEKLAAEDSGGSWEKGEGEHFIAKAAFPFTASQEGELSLTAGQLLVVAPQGLQNQQHAGWMLAAKDGKSGLVPTNYINIISKRNG